MVKNEENQIARIHELINYGNVSEAQRNTGMLTPKVEHTFKAADGKTYGILRECNKFYIKVAPPKDEGVEVLAEDFDYIGGYMNKKANEFKSYPLASKQFDLKMQAINEDAVRKQKVVAVETPSAEWQINETKEMRAEIDRFNQIWQNADRISEGKQAEFTTAHTLPEAPASNPSDEKVHDPFVETAVANGDKDFKATQDNPAKAAGPFEDSVGDIEKQLTSDKKPTAKSNTIFNQQPKYAPKNSVTTQHPTGGKAVKVDEGRTMRITEEQAKVLAWNSDPDYMNTTKGTEKGDTFPFSDPVTLPDGSIEIKANPTNGTPKGQTKPFTLKPSVQESRQHRSRKLNEWIDDEYDDDYDLLDAFCKEQGIDDVEIELDDDAKSLAMNDIQQDRARNAALSGAPMESRRRNGRRVTEDKLNVFGKHPAYQKQSMTTPTNKVSRTNRWGHEWDDESADNEKPYGTQLGDTYPYVEQVIDILTDEIMRNMDFTRKSR